MLEIPPRQVSGAALGRRKSRAAATDKRLLAKSIELEFETHLE